MIPVCWSFQGDIPGFCGAFLPNVRLAETTCPLRCESHLLPQNPGMSHEKLALQAALCFDRAICEAINQDTTKAMTPRMSAVMNVVVSKPLVNIEYNM